MLEHAAARTTGLIIGLCPEPAFATRQPTRFARPMLARSIMKKGRGEIMPKTIDRLTGLTRRAIPVGPSKSSHFQSI
jgi:hypothetical protein